MRCTGCQWYKWRIQIDNVPSKVCILGEKYKPKKCEKFVWDTKYLRRKGLSD
jgi:hypothetical protein